MRHPIQQQRVDRSELASMISRMGVCASASALNQLTVYLDMLCRWNAVMNLVGPRRWQDILTDLVVDSFFLAEFMEDLPLPGSPLCWDVGAGAGLPGIPLRMLWTRGVYHMVEAREKRALFLSNVLAQLRLSETYVFRGMAERFFATQARPADAVLSRAFMPWRQLVDFVQNRMQPEGILVVMSLEPAPVVLPEPWRVLRQDAYMTDGGERYFWALMTDGE
ncbi:MAG: class I SAM-dependent methyltransferase [Desulfovibrio sp.]|nr:class I SAM-dependent methyltransferase [Desulfovibrio sp.]